MWILTEKNVLVNLNTVDEILAEMVTAYAAGSSRGDTKVYVSAMRGGRSTPLMRCVDEEAAEKCVRGIARCIDMFSIKGSVDGVIALTEPGTMEFVKRGGNLE